MCTATKARGLHAATCPVHDEVQMNTAPGRDFFFVYWKRFPSLQGASIARFPIHPSKGYEETNQGMFGVGRALLARRIATIH